jgi:hypothetical protein
MNEELIEHMIGELTKLQIKAHCEDMQRGKKRYVLKEQAYKDLIQLLKTMKREVI